MTGQGLRKYVIAAVVVVAAAAGIWAVWSRSDAGSASSATKWERKENWRQIRPGMTQQQVRDLLGEPTASTSDPAFTQWTYGQGSRSGRVTFAGGMLRDWTSPK